ncbi:MAG: roadblock/LC7 domain-containing protein [Verrucomicrobiota bacterium]|nr:roadblock/LC7 domain-containing protein [Limisphaera sp.]MDW8381368.1 roadblock/LC7 domain-containing protein [Verrucomicrobiota bacterium]
MASLPQLLESDVQVLDAVLRELLKQCDATTALLTDQAGFLITHQGDDQQFDLTSMAALAAGAFMANQSIANLLHEPNFFSTYQQGEQYSLFMRCVEGGCMLLVIFPARNSVGAVKYFANTACDRLAAQLRIARERSPGSGIDLAELNLLDSESLFRRKP